MNEISEAVFDDDFYKYVSNFCHSRVYFCDYNDRNDAVQAAIIKIFINRHKYEKGHSCSFRTWACTIAKNHCLDYLRNQIVSNKKLINLDSLSEEVAENILKVDFVDRIEAVQEKRLKKNAERAKLTKLRNFLSGCSERDKNVVISKHAIGTQETAWKFNISRDNVRQIVSRVTRKSKDYNWK